MEKTLREEIANEMMICLFTTRRHYPAGAADKTTYWDFNPMFASEVCQQLLDVVLTLLSARIKAKALTDEQLKQIPVPEGYDREMAIAHAVAAAQLQAVLKEIGETK